MQTFGFETIAGDTDSLFLKANEEKYNNKEYVKKCLSQIIEIIKDNVPFPVDTFDIEIEHYIEYIMFPFSEEAIVDIETGEKLKVNKKIVKERKGKKKNYIYLYNDKNELKTKIVGLPIKKDNATPLGMKIFNEVLEKEIIENKRAKFSKEHIDSVINDYLKNKEIMKLLAVEYRVKEFNTYKKESQIQAQISKGYFDGREGIISLIKNKSVGKAGLGTKYCTVEEALANNLTVKELDLEKIYNELEPFIEFIESKQKFDKPKVAKVLKTKKITKIDSSISSQKKNVVKLDKSTNDVLYLKKEIDRPILETVHQSSIEKTIDWD